MKEKENEAHSDYCGHAESILVVIRSVDELDPVVKYFVCCEKEKESNGYPEEGEHDVANF